MKKSFKSGSSRKSGRDVRPADDGDCAVNRGTGRRVGSGGRRAVERRRFYRRGTRDDGRRLARGDGACRGGGGAGDVEVDTCKLVEHLGLGVDEGEGRAGDELG